MSVSLSVIESFSFFFLFTQKVVSMKMCNKLYTTDGLVLMKVCRLIILAVEVIFRVYVVMCAVLFVESF